MKNWFRRWLGNGSEQEIKPFYLGGAYDIVSRYPTTASFDNGPQSYDQDAPWNVIKSVTLTDTVLDDDEEKEVADDHHYIVTTICGSMRYYDDMIGVAEHLTRHGQVVLMPHCVKSPTGESINSHMLDAMHRQKIDMSDDIVVVGNYIGESTSAEIEYATSTGKHVRYYDPRILAYYKRLRSD